MQWFIAGKDSHKTKTKDLGLFPSAITANSKFEQDNNNPQYVGSHWTPPIAVGTRPEDKVPGSGANPGLISGNSTPVEFL